MWGFYDFKSLKGLRWPYMDEGSETWLTRGDKFFVVFGLKLVDAGDLEAMSCVDKLFIDERVINNDNSWNEICYFSILQR